MSFRESIKGWSLKRRSPTGHSSILEKQIMFSGDSNLFLGIPTFFINLLFYNIALDQYRLIDGFISSLIHKRRPKSSYICGILLANIEFIGSSTTTLYYHFIVICLACSLILLQFCLLSHRKSIVISQILW